MPRYPQLNLPRLAVAGLLATSAVLAQEPTGSSDNEPLLDCPDANVTDFAVKMIDGLNANGLVTFQSLIVGLSGGEEGYDLFASLAEYTHAYDAANDKDNTKGYTLLVPSDAAFEAAGYGNGGNWMQAAANGTDDGEGEADGSWGKLSEQQAVDLMKLHIVHGRWDASKLPDDGRNAVAPSLYAPRTAGKANLLKRAMDDIDLRRRWDLQRRQSPDQTTTENQFQFGPSSDKGAKRVATVMRKSDNGGGMTMKTAFGDVSSWSPLPDFEWTGLKGWNLVPIDFVMRFPPNISTALTLPTTTRSPDGLNKMAEAIDQVAFGMEESAKAQGKSGSSSNRAASSAADEIDDKAASADDGLAGKKISLDKRIDAFDTAHRIVSRQAQPKKSEGKGADALAQLTTGGLTFFAPVDDAWGPKAAAQMAEAKVGPRLLGNHYTNNETVFSTAWYNKNASLNVMTGQTLNIWYDSATSEHKLSMGNQTAVILRPDIVLENGVLHIIDKVLLVPSGAEDEPLRSMSPAEPTASSTGAGVSQTTSISGASETGKPNSGTAQSGAGEGRAVAVQMTLLALIAGVVAVLVQ